MAGSRRARSVSGSVRRTRLAGSCCRGGGDVSDPYKSMSEWTGCDKFGHQWQVKEPGRKECVHCAEERVIEEGGEA